MDFICHHAHAYTHCKEFGRYERVRFSLTCMGNSVWSAAITTFTAASVLSTCTTVTFFSEFGTFLATCMACSLAVALSYFHALLAIFGPDDPGAGRKVLGKLRGSRRVGISANALWLATTGE